MAWTAADIEPVEGPLAGCRVLELRLLVGGPFCGQWMDDMGAEVIKAEPSGDGDA